MKFIVAIAIHCSLAEPVRRGKHQAMLRPLFTLALAALLSSLHAQETHQVVFFWLDTANKVPVKMQAQDESFTALWSHYKAGPQDPALFEVPAGYQVMDMPMPIAPSAPAPGGDSP